MIIPVFDVKNNECVSGKSGKRDTYTKLSSIYGEDPIEITTNLKKSGAKCVYIADLDKIENKGDNSELILKINKILPVILDNGANSIDDIKFNKKICRYSILATETMESIEDTINIFKETPYENLIISIDIKNNELLTNNPNIKMEDIISLINEVKDQDKGKRKNKINEAIGIAYWLIATAIYLGWSFMTDDWHLTWVVWPIAGILFVVVELICNLVIDKYDEN